VAILRTEVEEHLVALGGRRQEAEDRGDDEGEVGSRAHGSTL